MSEQKERWCNKCDDYRIPHLNKWGTSIAIISDMVCPVCGEIFERTTNSKALMSKEKALELLEGLRQGLDMPLMTDENTALIMAIEALKSQTNISHFTKEEQM